MFPFASERSHRPVFTDLPPTLQPCAIAAAAPPADHLRAAMLSLLLYLLIVAAMVALSSLAPSPPLAAVIPPGPGPTVVYEPPELRVMIPATGGISGRGGVVESVLPVPPVVAPEVPSEAPAGMPTENHALDPAASGRSGPGTPPSQGGTPGDAHAGSTVQDFTSLGLAVLRRVDPIYPDFARRSRLQGPVVLMLTVNEQGQPVQVQVLQGHPVFHDVALQAARQWRFEPARQGGRPVAASFRLTLNFSLR
ncbi:MAG: TonB family protein [Holophagaceae bacterium]|uniref:TonB family protein n=1 Tax=Candidatus Geothrix skivensis TaxID=2954439 RepID=A0A9D7XKB1_9BACT|nr:TonB family protein [Candidatus Geothrix skivensis]